jgi:ABC-2 type transport system permease protein
VNPTFVRNEVRRTLRNRRFMIFAIAVPLVLFVVVTGGAGSGTKLGDLPLTAYMMVSMATFGTLSAVFSTGGRIAAERAAGWNRQLRLTSLTGGQYVSGKVITGFVAAVPTLLVVFVAGAIHGVHLPAVRWPAVGVSILFALLPISALGVWIGYVAKADSAQAIGGGIYALLSVLGGLWTPISDFPHWLRMVIEALPMYWIAQAGRSALSGSWVGFHGVAVIVAWTAAFGALAMRAYQRDSERA